MKSTSSFGDRAIEAPVKTVGFALATGGAAVFDDDDASAAEAASVGAGFGLSRQATRRTAARAIARRARVDTLGGSLSPARRRADTTIWIQGQCSLQIE